MKRYYLALIGLLFFPAAVQASGFMIPEQGTKAMGLAEAFGSIAEDASANWYNPAGLAFQENSVSVGGTIVAPKNDYTTGGQKYGSKNGVFFIPQVYARYAPEDSKLSYGLGVNAPFGLSTDWTNSGAPFSQVMAGADSITFSQIEAVHINPNVAYRISDNIAVAVGASYYYATKVHLDNQSLNIGGHGDGFGGNVALLYKEGDLGLGLTYRSRVKLNISGTAIGGPALALLGLQGIGANATTSVTLPDLVSGGISYRLNDQWLVSLQADWINWKTFDKIVINYAPSMLNIATGSSSTVPENWKATTAIRFGVQWDYSKTMRARFGYTYDPTPTNDTDFSPRLPGADRQLVALGYGYDYSEAVTLDFAYSYLWLNRTLSAPGKPIYQGKYKTTGHLFAGTMNYRF